MSLGGRKEKEKKAGACATYFMQRECRWQRDVGTRTRQEGKASSRVWLLRSSVRDRSCRAWGESSLHLQAEPEREDRKQRVSGPAERGQRPPPGLSSHCDRVRGPMCQSFSSAQPLN